MIAERSSFVKEYGVNRKQDRTAFGNYVEEWVWSDAYVENDDILDFGASTEFADAPGVHWLLGNIVRYCRKPDQRECVPRRLLS